MRRTLLEIADELRAIATTGLHYTAGRDEARFDHERYERLLELAVRLAATAGERPPEEIRQVFVAADHGYVTPKLDARMAVFRGTEVLLVRERHDGLWALPGGYVDVGDSPAEAAERETLEEAGVEVRAARLAGIFDYRLQPAAPPMLFHIHKLVFVGECTGGEATPRPGPDVLDARFFPLDTLPALSEGRTLALHIRTARERALDPSKPAHFD
jgi:ADP-ribose pyrophosphatase YjhB (NUDIX family)